MANDLIESIKRKLGLVSPLGGLSPSDVYARARTMPAAEVARLLEETRAERRAYLADRQRALDEEARITREFFEERADEGRHVIEEPAAAAAAARRIMEPWGQRRAEYAAGGIDLEFAIGRRISALKDALLERWRVEGEPAEVKAARARLRAARQAALDAGERAREARQAALDADERAREAEEALRVFTPYTSDDDEAA